MRGGHTNHILSGERLPLLVGSGADASSQHQSAPTLFNVEGPMVQAFAFLGLCAVFAFAVAWRLKTSLQPIDQAFSDFTEADHPTDAVLLQRLYACEGTGCEAGVCDHPHSISREA